jgi:hypothetical protein
MRGSRVARGGVDFLAERDLLREGDQVERIRLVIKMAVGARRRRGVRLIRRVEQRERFGGAADRAGADVARMGKARHFARHGAEAETGVGRIVGGLEPAVVEAEALGRAILQVQFAVIGLGERFARERLRQIGVERVGAIEEAAGIGRACHRRDIGRRTTMRKLPSSLRASAKQSPTISLK